MQWRVARRWLAAGLLVLTAPLAAPQLLAFPYRATIGQHAVRSERPIVPRLAALVAAADARARTSPLAPARALDQAIFLTGGGWRWSWLTLTGRGAFAISRPLSETIVVNRSDVAANRVSNGAAVGGARPLDATLAHEFAHGLIRAHFGAWIARRAPSWLVEGYCDYVAGGGSLSDAQAAALIARGEAHPALVYWRGRKLIERVLAGNGGDVGALFATYDRP